MSAIKNGNITIAQELIAAGAGVNQADSDGNTPHMLAAKTGYHDIAQELIEAGADVTQVDREDNTFFMSAH